MVASPLKADVVITRTVTLFSFNARNFRTRPPPALMHTRPHKMAKHFIVINITGGSALGEGKGRGEREGNGLTRV